MAYQDTLGQNWLELFLSENSRVSSALVLIVIFVAQSALQPWFVGAGFGLYINSRTQLEAWDIEVAFRRMVQRRAKNLVAAAVLAILAFPALLLPGGAQAIEPGESTEESMPEADPGFSGFWDDDEVHPAIDKVIASDALKTTRDISEWQSVNANETDLEPNDGIWKWWVEQLRRFGRLVSLVVEFGLWILVAALLCLLLVTRKRWLPYLRRRPAEARSILRVSLAGGELSAAELPADIPAEVLRLWRSDAKRKALSLLYRGSVFAAVTRHGVRLPPSATEGACLLAVGQQSGTVPSAYFTRVVAAWIQCAYAFDEPGDDTVLPLCSEWSRHYGDLL
jgi:hypothetical protein